MHNMKSTNQKTIFLKSGDPEKENSVMSGESGGTLNVIIDI